jgi:hypothetical protein
MQTSWRATHLAQVTLGHASLTTTSRYLHAQPNDSSVWFFRATQKQDVGRHLSPSPVLRRRSNVPVTALVQERGSLWLGDRPGVCALAHDTFSLLAGEASEHDCLNQASF